MVLVEHAFHYRKSLFTKMYLTASEMRVHLRHFQAGRSTHPLSSLSFAFVNGAVEGFIAFSIPICMFSLRNMELL